MLRLFIIVPKGLTEQDVKGDFAVCATVTVCLITAVCRADELSYLNNKICSYSLLWYFEISVAVGIICTYRLPRAFSCLSAL